MSYNLTFTDEQADLVMAALQHYETVLQEQIKTFEVKTDEDREGLELQTKQYEGVQLVHDQIVMCGVANELNKAST